MTKPGTQTFVNVGIFALAALLCGCNPISSMEDEKTAESTFLVDDAKLFDRDNAFSLKDILVYPKAERKGPENISTAVTNKKLTMYRCTWCHECGFTEAFDYENLGSEEWNPRYVGEAWKPIVYRMNENDETMLNEQLAERVYDYLRDESLGVYVEEEDHSDRIEIEVDDLSKVMVGPGTNVKRSDGTDDSADSEADPPADSGSSGDA